MTQTAYRALTPPACPAPPSGANVARLGSTAPPHPPGSSRACRPPQPGQSQRELGGWADAGCSFPRRARFSGDPKGEGGPRLWLPPRGQGARGRSGRITPFPSGSPEGSAAVSGRGAERGRWASSRRRGLPAARTSPPRPPRTPMAAACTCRPRAPQCCPGTQFLGARGWAAPVCCPCPAGGVRCPEEPSRSAVWPGAER